MPTPLELTTVIYPDGEAVIDEVRRLRALLPPSAIPMMEAHVTIYGTFYELDPQEALARLQAICRHHPPFTLRATGLQAWFGGGGPARTMNENRRWLRLDPLEGYDEPGAGIVAPVSSPAALVDLHLAVYSALADADVVGDGFGAPQFFKPHLTIVQSFPRRLLLEALERIGDAPDWTFAAHEVALMQREPDGFRVVGTAPLLGRGSPASPASDGR